MDKLATVDEVLLDYVDKGAQVFGLKYTEKPPSPLAALGIGGSAGEARETRWARRGSSPRTRRRRSSRRVRATPPSRWCGGAMQREARATRGTCDLCLWGLLL